MSFPSDLEIARTATIRPLAEIAATGGDRISLGALTHSVPNWDVGFDWVAGHDNCP